VGWGACFLWALHHGTARSFTPEEVWRGAKAALGLGDPLPEMGQPIWRARALRALMCLSVGASLALAGALLQALFQNALASPDMLGVTAGSSLGASLVLAAVGGAVPGIVVHGAGEAVWVTVGGLVGAGLVLLPLLFVAGGGGRLSVPTLLLAGMAMNALCAGLFAALQSRMLSHLDVLRALFAWSFGVLNDRTELQVSLVCGAFGLGLLAIPLVSRELELLAGGEEDAAALGVDVRKVRLGVLFVAAVLAGTAVSAAGQIAFVGLIVPHLVRLVLKGSLRATLVVSSLGGGLFVLGTDALQRAFLPRVELGPGVVMSFFGALFLLWMLAFRRAELRAW